MPYLISGQSTSGSGVNITNGVFPIAVAWADKSYVLLETSGNSASATLWGNVSDDTRTWMKVTSWAQGPGTTATAQISSFFFSLMGTVDWASGGTITGTVYMQVAPRRLWLG